ncbi:hypothetical protein [Pectobacterium odoriferum]|uniref:hypothetical protein n=1 Tax=Pectobacterium odoriferum TaxID=78398 RepID=UPI0030B96BC9
MDPIRPSLGQELPPFAIPEEQVGKRKRFEIHHVKNIQHSGEVYNIDNLRVNTPKNHIGLH